MRSCTHPSAARRKHTGFTLIELLVVILIIAVLAVLSFLGYSRYRDMADKTRSINNLRQIMMANASYAADHSGRYVPLYATDEEGSRTGFWFQDADFIRQLVGNVTNAAGNPTRQIPVDYLDQKAVRRGHTHLAMSFGMNDTGLMARTGPNVRASQYSQRIANPSGSMAFATATDYRITYNNRIGGRAFGRTTNGSMAYRHGGQEDTNEQGHTIMRGGAALVAFYDGSAREMTEADIREIDNTRGGRSSSFWDPTQNR